MAKLPRKMFPGLLRRELRKAEKDRYLQFNAAGGAEHPAAPEKQE